MNESENIALQHSLGVDGEGKLLTDERRVERAQEVQSLVQRSIELYEELTYLRATISHESSLDVSERSVDVGVLVARCGEINKTIIGIKALIDLKASTRYPAPRDTKPE